MQVAEYIAQSLEQYGVNVVFMLTGTGSIHLCDAVAARPSLRHICARHEANAVFMASAVARLKGTIGVAIVTTGPGAINAISGVAEAYVESVPILVLSGQESRQHYTPDCRSFGIQGFDITAAAQRMTKYAAVVDDPSQIRHHLEKAVHAATTGRPGPVWLDIPFDVQAASVSIDALQTYIPTVESVPIDAMTVESDAKVIADLLDVAERPLIVIGQGIRCTNLLGEVRALAASINAPILATRLALDLLPLSDPYFLGLGGVRGRPANASIAREADLILSLGASLSPGFVGQYNEAFSDTATIIKVEIDTHEAAKPGTPATHIIRQDAAEILAILNRRDDIADNGRRDAWITHCRQLKQSNVASHPTNGDHQITPYLFVERLEAHSRSNDIFVSDTGSAYYATGQVLRFDHGQKEVTSAAFATMGVAIPFAIGAALSARDVRALAITGDGSIELNIQELRTVSELYLPVKIFVLNNGGYASIRESQDKFCAGRYVDQETILDFRKVAETFGLPYRRIEGLPGMDAQIAATLADTEPALIEVMCDRSRGTISLY